MPMRTHTSLFVLLFSLAAVALAAHANDNTYVYDNVGGWTIRTDGDRNYNCHAEAEFAGGSILRVGLGSSTGALDLSIGDPAWNSVEPGLAYRVEITFDDAAAWRFEAVGLALETELDQPSVRLTIEENVKSRFTQALMQGNALAVSYEDSELAPLSLSLAGSNRAITVLEECQATMARID